MDNQTVKTELVDAVSGAIAAIDQIDTSSETQSRLAALYVRELAKLRMSIEKDFAPSRINHV